MFQKNKWIILAALSVFYWCSRPVNPESDIPKWKTFYYSQVDELFYTIGAFNIISKPGSAYAEVAQNDFMPVNLFEDVVTAASLSLFGDNYIGLRFPSMLMGYFVLVLVFLLFEKRFGGKGALIAAALLLLDVGFLLSNRIAEPTIFRLAGMLAVIYFLQRMLDKAVTAGQFFFAGFLGCFAFLFFYPTNFFIAPATFIFLLLLFIHKKKAGTINYSYWGYYFLSSLICFAIFLFISKLVMGNLDRFSNMADFSGRVAVTGEKPIFTTLKGFASNIYALKDASFFFFNPYMLGLAVVTGGYFIYAAFTAFYKTGQLTIDQVVLIFLLMFLCQTVFINDYPRKKLLMFFPFVIYSLVYGIDTMQKKYSGSILVKYAYLVTVPVLAASVYFQFKFVYSKPTFHYKKAMLSLKKYDGKIIAGNLAYAFRLYNHYTPLLNYYAYKYHNYDEHQRILRLLSTDKNFAGSIYDEGQKYIKELKKVNLCPAEPILPLNPNFPALPVYMGAPCTVDTGNVHNLNNGIIQK